MSYLSNNMEIIYSIFGVALAIISFFLNRYINKSDDNEKQTQQNTLDIQVLKTDHANKHQHMIEKFDMLNDNIKELNLTIKDLKDTIDNK